MSQINDILKGNQAAGAKLIRSIEENEPNASESIKELYPHSGNAFIIGITGPPGAGKSSLINGLITNFRKLDKKVGVIAIDPTSPFSGGALLGDRTRMQQHATDEGVFIRSMATRNQLGGLSKITKDAVIILDAMGFEIIIIETVGAGQTEIEVTKLAHSTGVVDIPGTGDGIQAAKAGILETGDIFIINKYDRPDAVDTFLELQIMIEMRQIPEGDWVPPIIKTSAKNDSGIMDLANAFLSHFEFMKEKGILEDKIKQQELYYFNSVLKDQTLEKLLSVMEESDLYKQLLDQIGSRKIDPFNAANILANKMINTNISL